MTDKSLTHNLPGHNRLAFVSHRSVLAALVIVALAIVLTVVIASRIATESTVSPDSAPAVLKATSDETDATYTDRYWQMAAEYEAARAPAAAPAETYATYTDRYWQMAAEHAAATAPAAALAETYATYTDRYWQMANTD